MSGVTQLPSHDRSRAARLESLARADPGNSALQRAWRDALNAEGQFDRLLTVAEADLRSGSGDEVALFDKATALLGLKRYAEAIDVLERLRAQRPEVTAIAANLALAHYTLGEFSLARPYLDHNHAAGVRSADHLRLILSTYHHLGLMDEAIAIADAATSEQGATLERSGALAGVLALLYLDGDKPVQAARWARAALALNRDSIDGLVVEATLRAARLDGGRAKATFARVLTLAPDNGRAWVGLGALALLDQDLPTAKEHLKRGLASLPTHVGSWHTLAWCEVLGGGLEEAERIFRHTLELDRNFAESHGGLASVLAMRGRRAEAEAALQIAERLDPEALSPRFARSVLMGQGGDPGSARAVILQTLATLSPRDGGQVSRIIDELTGSAS